jgi:hypothetical protein
MEEDVARGIIRRTVREIRHNVARSAWLELSCQKLVYDAVSNRSGKGVASLVVDLGQRRLQNLSTGKLVSIFKQLLPEESLKREGLVPGSQVSDQIDSLVRLRNSVAHGSTSAASMAQVKSYFFSAKSLISGLRKLI